MNDVQLLADMIRVRVFEERCAELYGETKIRGFLHLYIGEEAIAAGVMSCLTPQDSVLATYREHAHALLRGATPRPGRSTRRRLRPRRRAGAVSEESVASLRRRFARRDRYRRREPCRAR